MDHMPETFFVIFAETITASNFDEIKIKFYLGNTSHCGFDITHSNAFICLITCS